MEEENLAGNLNALVIQLGLQLEQDSKTKEDLIEQTQLNAAKALDVKQQILLLREQIKSCDESISNLQRYSKSSKDTSDKWKTTCEILAKHEELLQSQLDSEINKSEDEKKIYQNMISQAKETFIRYQEQYMKSPLAKEYYTNKQEVDEIRSRIHQYVEQRKKEEERILGATVPAPFQSVNEWAIRLATLRKNTNEILKETAVISQATSNMIAESAQLEQKLKYIKQHQHISEEQNKTGSEKIAAESKERIPDKEADLKTSDEKQKPRLFIVPSLDQRWRQPMKGKKDKEKHTEESTPSDIMPLQHESLQKDKQSLSLTSDEGRAHIHSTTRLRNQAQVRLVLTQAHAEPKSKPTDKAELNKDNAEEAPSKSKDLASGSQDIPSSYEGMEQEEASSGSNPLQRMPASFTVSQDPSTAASTLVRVPELNTTKRPQDSKTSTAALAQSTVEKSENPLPFRFFMTSTPKTPRLSMFESFQFQSSNLPEQDGRFSDVNTSTASSPKDIESIFGKMEGDDEFAFTFPSKATQSFGEEKDEFGFIFPFGQDQRSSQQSEHSQSSKFTFF